MTSEPDEDVGDKDEASASGSDAASRFGTLFPEAPPSRSIAHQSWPGLGRSAEGTVSLNMSGGIR